MAFRDTGTAAKNQRRAGWENAEFPVVCATCLGDNPYLRMTKAQYDKECKVCMRPFTVFRWKPGAKARYKKTEICQVCAKVKNVCQTCLLDLEFGLPVQVRDSQLSANSLDPIAFSDVNREYFADQATRLIESGEMDFQKQHQRSSELLQRLARTEPYHKRNQAHLCSFFLKGDCTRGSECPYRHEIPEDDPALAQQNLRDRYHGVNDPVAKKLLTKAQGFSDNSPPADTSITTLYVGGITPEIKEEDLKDQFYAYGEVTEMTVLTNKNCAFVTYRSREDAERASRELSGKLVVKDIPLRLQWGHNAPSQSGGMSEPASSIPPRFTGPTVTPYYIPPSYGVAPPPGVISSGGGPPMGPPQGVIYYPSMDPSQFGSRPADHPASAQPLLKKPRTVPSQTTDTTSTRKEGDGDV